MRKKVLAVLVAAAMALPTVTVWGAEGKKELTVWHYYTEGGKLDSLNTIKEEFEEENPDYEVVYTYIPRDEMDKQYSMGAVSGELPDIMLVDICTAAVYVEMGICADITDYFNEWEDKDKFLEQPMSAMSKDGKIYGIPQNVNSLAVYYDKAAFKDAGIESEPTTWDELLDVCATLKEKYPDKFPFGFSANDNEEGTFQFLPFFFSTGATLEEFGSDAGVKALDLWKTMVDEGYVSKDVVSWGQSEVKSQFEAGNVLMEVNGSWDIAQMKIDVPDKEIGVFQIPKDSEYASILGGEGFAMSTSCEDPEIGWNYLKTLGSGKNIAEFAEASACFPARTDGEEYSDYWTSDEQMAVFNEAVKNAKVRGPHARWTEISEEISGAIQAVLTGAKDAKTAMGEAQEKINSIMES